MDKDILLKTIQNKLAVNMVESLTEEERKEIIAEAIVDKLSSISTGWEVENILRDEVLKYACEYIQKPEVEKKLMDMAVQTAEEVIYGIQKAAREALEDCIKSKYQRFLSGKKYSDK